MTDTEIINAALGQLGCNPITQLGDVTTAEGKIAKAQYALAKDALLSLRQWTFAKARDQLTQDAATPAFGYTFRYLLPNNVLSVIRVYRTGQSLPRLVEDWEREGSYILCDEDNPVYAEMMLRVPESGFHPMFTKALVAQLAADWAMPLTENRTLADAWETKASARLLEAAVADGKQGISEVIVPRKIRGRRR